VTALLFVALFLASSLLMIWRLESMAAAGMEGTVLGTLITPYSTGMPNLLFVFVLARRGGAGSDVLINCLVNNVTNLTLLIGLPAAIWGLAVLPDHKKSSHAHHADRLSMLLTLLAVLLFTGTAWVLGRRHTIGFGEGLILVGLFVCWQLFHLFDLLQSNRRQKRAFGWTMAADLVLLAVGTYGTYVSTNWLVGWVSNIQTGFISAKHLGWLSGWLDVLPNAALAFYYGWKRQAEVVYTSQIGDGHICIPLCIGIFALFRPIVVKPFFQTGVLILGAATLLHLVFIGIWGRLPRLAGLVLIAGYGFFLYQGLLQ
jgi:cation:H+ antiporter